MTVIDESYKLQPMEHGTSPSPLFRRRGGSAQFQPRGCARPSFGEARGHQQYVIVRDFEPGKTVACGGEFGQDGIAAGLPPISEGVANVPTPSCIV
jgi:hypothetical protein